MKLKTDLGADRITFYTTFPSLSCSVFALFMMLSPDQVVDLIPRQTHSSALELLLYGLGVALTVVNILAILAKSPVFRILALTIDAIFWGILFRLLGLFLENEFLSQSDHDELIVMFGCALLLETVVVSARVTALLLLFKNRSTGE